MQMTIFYSKFTGEIKLITSGIADFDIFLNNELDMRSFCKKATTCMQNDIIKDTYKYKVDLKTNEIVLKQEFLTYPVKLTLQMTDKTTN